MTEQQEHQLELPLGPYIIGIVAGHMGSGKTEVAKRLISEHNFAKVSFAAPLKRMVSSLLRDAAASPSMIDDMINGDAKELRIPLFGDKSARELMQTLGSEWGRDIVDTDLWVNIGMNNVSDMICQGYSVVIDDVRFPNEVDAIVQMGGVIIYLDRETTEEYNQLPEAITGHQSEGWFKPEDCHATIYNRGTVEDLHKNVDYLVSFIPELLKNRKNNSAQLEI